MMTMDTSQAFFDATAGTPFKTPGRKRGLDLNQLDENFDTKKPKLQQTTMKNFLSNNKYGGLPDNDEGNLSPTKNLDNGNTSKKFKPPPIILHTELKKPKETYKQIQTWAKKPIYFKVINNLRHIHTSDKSDFYEIRKKLDEIKFEYQTHTPKDEIPKKLILKGLDEAYTAEEVKEDLKSQLDSVVDVKRLSKTTSTGEKVPINVFIVYFTYETRLSVAMKVLQYCCLHRIKLDYFKRSGVRRYTQCFNCQSFGHESRNCTLKYKCVKCTESHAPGECSKRKEDKNAVCVNCNGSHPANYRGCVKAKQYIAKKNKISNNNNKRTNTNTQYTSNSNITHTVHKTPRTPHGQQTRRTLTYADKLKQNIVQPRVRANYSDARKQSSNGSMFGVGSENSGGPSMVSGSVFMHDSTSNNFGFITSEIDSLFGVSMLSLMKSINVFVPQYRLCTDKLKKQMMLLEFMLNFAN